MTQVLREFKPVEDSLCGPQTRLKGPFWRASALAAGHAGVNRKDEKTTMNASPSEAQ